VSPTLKKREKKSSMRRLGILPNSRMKPQVGGGGVGLVGVLKKQNKKNPALSNANT